MELKINLELSKEQIVFLKALAKNVNLLFWGVSNEDLLRLRDLGLIYRNDSLGWISTALGKQVVDSLEPNLASEYLKEKGYEDTGKGGFYMLRVKVIETLLNGYLDYVHNYMNKSN